MSIYACVCAVDDRIKMDTKHATLLHGLATRTIRTQYTFMYYMQRHTLHHNGFRNFSLLYIVVGVRKW